MSTQNRVITAFATRGKNKQKIETNVTTWGELKPLLEEAGYNLGSLAATESINRTDLANEGAKLPEGDFVVFLRPVKTKSGGKALADMSWKEMRDSLDDDAKGFLNGFISGKSWTQLKTDELRDGLTAYQKKSGGSKKASETTNAEVTNVDRVASINSLLTEIKANSSSEEVFDRVDALLEELEGLGFAVADEVTDPDAKETQELESQFGELAPGFSDACSAKKLT